MQHDFLPVVIRYDGMDADGHVIDLGLLGQSIQGASKLLGSAGSIVLTGQFAKKTKSMSVRVLAGLSCTRFRRHQVRCFMELKVCHGETEVYARVQA
jgi:hypothetical protein